MSNHFNLLNKYHNEILRCIWFCCCCYRFVDVAVIVFALIQIDCGAPFVVVVFFGVAILPMPNVDDDYYRRHFENGPAPPPPPPPSIAFLAVYIAFCCYFLLLFFFFILFVCSFNSFCWIICMFCFNSIEIALVFVAFFKSVSLHVPSIPIRNLFEITIFGFLSLLFCLFCLLNYSHFLSPCGRALHAN